MYIGELASLTGTTPKAIRHYEKLGLLPVAKRKGNYRIYEPIDVQSVKMIRLAQSVGFSLAELYELSILKYKLNRFPVEIAKKLISQKQQQILKYREHLDHQQANLKQLEDEITDTYTTANEPFE
jgi:DNA-binding transcriptional MerR regulator